MTRTGLRARGAVLAVSSAALVAAGAPVASAEPAAPAVRTSSGTSVPRVPSLAGLAVGGPAATALHAFAAAPEVVEQAQTRQAAEAKAAKAAKIKAAQRKAAAERLAAKRGDRQRASRSAARVSGSPKAIARTLAARRGWGADQFGCLDRLWTKESGWQVTADNPTSSAYGIPQALPGSKMASKGSDWRTNPATQIAWGLDYINDRYGTPCGAWAHSRANNWY